MYLDSCIVVKLLTPESDSLAWDRQVTGATLTTSELAVTEVASALLAKERAGAINPADRERAWVQLESWIARQAITLAPLTGAVLRKATRVLLHCHPQIPLRTLDAIHLATADLGVHGPLCTTDGRMRAAASRIGLDLLPVP